MSSASNIFKSYDIRGRIDTEEITSEIALRIGKAVSHFTKSQAVVIGWDARLSSPELAQSVAVGVLASGKEAVLVGLVPTDLIYTISGIRQVAGVMVTASHNPPEYNGFKICDVGAVPVGEDSGLSLIRSLVNDPPPEASTAGKIRKEDVRDIYLDHLLALVNPVSDQTGLVVVDGGNGVAGAVIEPLFARIPYQLEGLFLEPDGTFPNHLPNPLQPANLSALTAKVTETSALLGVAFDGDADRAFFIDEQGRPLSGSTTTALIARMLLTQSKGATVVHNLICSRAVPEVIQTAGGKPIRTRVGHSNIKEVMRSQGALFGGEHSGHYYFSQNFYADSAVLALLMILQILAETNRPLSELAAEVELYCASGELNYKVRDHEAVLAKIPIIFSTGEVDQLDGLTVSWEDRWFNLRPSNTEPLLRLNAEADDGDTLAKMVSQVERIIEECGGIAD